MTHSDTQYYINPNLFFLFEKGALCLWNDEAHEQFQIEKDLMTLLIDIVNKVEIKEDTTFLKDLLENEVCSL